MQRPPQLPAILSSRQDYQWVGRLSRKLTEIDERGLSADTRQRAEHFLEVKFVQAMLRLEGREVTNTSFAQLAQEQDNAALIAPRQSPDDAGKTAAAEVHRALRLVKAYVHSNGRDAALTVELLLQLHRAAGGTGWRERETADASVRAAQLPLIVENACRWFSMASIAELNPVEQAALALLRLVEIAPFATGNERAALLAASLFPLRAGLPPVIIEPTSEAAYRQALDEGLRRMNTRPLVELLAVAIERDLDTAYEDAI